MKTLLSLFLLSSSLAATAGPSASLPVFTDDGRLQPPADYREWVFLSSGVDMSYNEAARERETPVYDNVFAAPAAYRAFVETGHWPEQTMLVLEIRDGQKKGSINHRGSFQSPNRLAVEVHVKDTKRFPDTDWAFFSIDGDGPAAQIPSSQDCYSCHREHAAVDTTFVQFYPTLLPIAERRGTFSAAYRAASGAKK